MAAFFCQRLKTKWGEMVAELAIFFSHFPSACPPKPIIFIIRYSINRIYSLTVLNYLTIHYLVFNSFCDKKEVKKKGGEKKGKSQAPKCARP